MCLIEEKQFIKSSFHPTLNFDLRLFVEHLNAIRSSEDQAGGLEILKILLTLRCKKDLTEVLSVIPSLIFRRYAHFATIGTIACYEIILATMSSENGYGNVMERVRRSNDEFVNFMMIMNVRNDADFVRFCGYYNIIMSGVQESNPNWIIPILTRWNQFDGNSLP
ncbi:unnamed protein product [Caenorhabditis angaria]|uniref:Uncharacterized protein n=1 Tax=Caenorhabditis angaria TaxID=860376 RepID=A0A9P1J406_9PELO|nr:unnamed protein product [Caenorhabditis angaria]